jgi:glucose-6-phosphate isomerase, archaeal
MTPIQTDLTTGHLVSTDVIEATRTVGDLTGYWSDAEAASAAASVELYRTQTWMCAEEGTEGAILWGNTTLFSGVVGDEYFMTRGHWHLKRDRGELCVTVSGRGTLVLMDERRQTRIEWMTPGSTHYVPGHTAHRTVNVGEEPLVFLCSWPADCGHEYADIAERGFSARVLKVNGEPQLVAGG